MADVEGIIKLVEAHFLNNPNVIKYAKSFNANSIYYTQNREELQRRYGGKVVIIFNEGVVSTSGDFEDFSNEIGKLNDVERAGAFVVHVPKENELIIV